MSNENSKIRETELREDWQVSVEAIKHTSDLIQVGVKKPGSNSAFLSELYDRLIEEQTKAMQISVEYEKLTGQALM
ncbi:MAG: hypothetical protein FWF77_01405 [Defluviitaleaceae bacterium]|nr:hypothetical protein [Defluviitaleaceae bacterium]